jgi:signal transduction histidine kinase
VTDRSENRLAPMLSPLSLAACAAWAAVWFSLDGLMARDPSLGWLARGCALVFLAAFLTDDWLLDRFGRRVMAAHAAGMALVSLPPIALTPGGAAPILLILLAAQLGARYEGRVLWSWLLAVNLAAALVILTYWPSSRYLWLSIVAYGSFQVFAALVMRYAMRAEQMSQALRIANADLVATRGLLAEGVRDQERLRLSRDLHDVAGHKLTALKLNLTALTRDAATHPDPRLALCAQLADELMADIRGVVQTLRAEDGIDLEDTLRTMASALPRPRLELEVDRLARPATLGQAEAVLRTVQEALTNAARHSEARTLWAVLSREPGRLHLDLRDDGRRQGELRSGNGLRGMRERLEALGGGLDIGHTQTGGVHLKAWLPLAAP